MSIKKERNIEREKTAIDNLTYGTDKFKKQDEMLIVGLTKKQKSALKTKDKIAKRMGESVDVNEVLDDPAFKAAGDKKDPATKQEVEAFLNQL
tara:strand:+ start:535 stop:813 length:279 start_codon:yes stop_codon:yes gene_type:complete